MSTLVTFLSAMFYALRDPAEGVPQRRFFARANESDTGLHRHALFLFLIGNALAWGGLYFLIRLVILPYWRS